MARDTLQHQMSRTRRHLSRFPLLCLWAKLELQSAAANHQLVMLNPVLLPRLAVGFYALYEETSVFVVKSIGCYAEGGIAVDGHVDVREPGRADQEDRLCYYGVQA